MSHSLRSRLLSVAFLLVAMVVGIGAPAAAIDAALGEGGRLYTAIVGKYGDLFPEGFVVPRENVVLALEISRPGEQTRRLLVPGTEGTGVESAPSILVDGQASKVFLVWESTFNLIHSGIHLTALDENGDWQDAIEVSGNPFTLKTAPRLAVTRDSFTNLDGSGVEHERLILHTVWWEETGSGNRISYAPIVLVDGSDIGENLVYSLDAYDDGEEAWTDWGSPEIFLSPAVASADTADGVISAFANQETGRVVTLRLGVLPVELTQIAEQARGFVAGSGIDCTVPEQRLELAQRTWAFVLQLGRERFHPVPLLVMANEARDSIATSACAQGLEGLAANARMHIIGAGARGRGRLLMNAEDAARMHIVGAGLRSMLGVEHALEIRLVKSLPLPSTGPGPTFLYPSADGERVLVAWLAGDRLYYRESEADGWSSAHHLQLGDRLSLEEAQSILRSRINGP